MSVQSLIPETMYEFLRFVIKAQHFYLPNFLYVFPKGFEKEIKPPGIYFGFLKMIES